MPEACTITLAIPPEALERLKEAEKRQRAETKRRDLPAEAVSVEALILLQTHKGVVLCGCGCGQPLDFDAKWTAKNTPPGFPIIAHRLSRGSRGGHVVGNVFIDRDACNKRDAGPDTSGAASVKRFTPNKQPKLLDTQTSVEPKRWSSAGLRKPEGYKHKWPKRKMGK